MPRVIRKLDLAGRPTFDEQLWPINALLVVLCALVAGVIIGASEFTEELAWSNGWVRLATLLGSVCLLMGLAWWFRGKIGRRFQLGAAASLVLHAAIGILLHLEHLELLQDHRETARRDTPPVLVQYEYPVRSPDERAPQEAHERPVDTETPENRPIELSRIAPAEPRIDEREPQPLPETQPAVEPTQMQMQRNEFAAPKRADQESQLSRSTTEAPARPSEQISAPEQRPATQPTAPALEAAATAVARQESTARAQPASTETPTTVEVRRDAAQPARRAAEDTSQPAPSARTQTIARAVASPADAAATTATAPANVAQAESNQTLEARESAVARSETASELTPNDNTGNQLASQPTVATATPSASRAVNESQPALSPTNNTPSATRALAQAAAPSTVADQPTGIAANTPAPSSSAFTGPAQAEVARAATAAPARSVQSDASAAASASLAAASPAAASRREATAAPSVNAAAQMANAPARAASAAANAASPVNLESPALAAGSASDTPSQQPAATSLTRSTAGATGVGQSPNFDRSLAGPASDATVASAASQRAASTLDAGAAPAASSPAALRRTSAQAPIDSTTALAQDAAPADYRGGPAPAQVEATSGAAVARSASNAPQGSISADPGNLPADTGAQRVVSRGGLARSDGGGQPTVATVANAGVPGRSTAAGEAASLIASDVVAPSAVRPMSDGATSANAAIVAQNAGVSRTTPSGAVGDSPRVLTNPAAAGAPTSVAAASGAPVRTEQSGPAATTNSTAAPARSTASAVTGDTRAQDVQVASAPQPASSNDGTPLDTSVAGGERGARTPLGRTALAAVGALAAAMPLEAPSGAEQGAVAGQRAQEPGTAGPEVNPAATGSGAPLSRSITAAAPAAAGDALDVPALSSDAPAATNATAGDAQAGPSTGPNAVARRSTGGVPVQVASVPGPGGLGAELSAVVGARKTTAQRESDLIHDTDTRFLGREITGAIPAPSFIREAARAFERRGRDNGTGQGQQGAKTEEAIERGLEFLARAQQADGSWSFQRFPGATEDDIGMIHSDTAATGLALMSFLGGGYDHFEDKHRDTVRRGLHFLLRQQKESGDLYVAQHAESHKSAWLYSHAIGSIALCEALGMTGDEELRGPAQRAIQFIETAQDPQYGGWRYQPGTGSDTSVAGWQLMALKSGELAGLAIKRETYDAVRKWLDRAQVKNDGAQYVYNPTAPNTQYSSDQRRPTMTSVGLLMRLYLGWDRARPELARGAENILAYPPAYGTSSNPTRDTYYWYYATQVMFHMRGEHWRQWNARLHPLLVNSQVKQGELAGSWHPGGNVPDRWGPQGGRIYVTTLNLLSLEVYYRHLPIYEETAR